MNMILLVFLFFFLSEGTPGRDANCTADSNPVCQPCEGLGGIIPPAGGTIDDIIVPKCQPIGGPNDIGKENRTQALFPNYWTANFSGSYSSLALARPLDSNYYTVTGEYKYDLSWGAIRFENHQHIIDKKGKEKINTVWGWHEGDNLATMNEKFGIKYCYCMVPYLVNGTAVGPLSPSAFLDATYVGREILNIEYINEVKTVDHYMLSFYHIWMDVESGLPIRTINRQKRGKKEEEEWILTVYHDWIVQKPDSSTWKIDEACFKFYDKSWDNCAKMQNQTQAEWVTASIPY